LNAHKTAELMQREQSTHVLNSSMMNILVYSCNFFFITASI